MKYSLWSIILFTRSKYPPQKFVVKRRPQCVPPPPPPMFHSELKQRERLIAVVPNKYGDHRRVGHLLKWPKVAVGNCCLQKQGWGCRDQSETAVLLLLAGVRNSGESLANRFHGEANGETVTGSRLDPELIIIPESMVSGPVPTCRLTQVGRQGVPLKTQTYNNAVLRRVHLRVTDSPNFPGDASRSPWLLGRI